MEFHTHKFVTANQKWGESQQNGTPGGLVSFSYAEMNYIEQFSDFNDLANRSKLGIEGVKRQIKPKVDRMTNRYRSLYKLQARNIVHIA